MSDRIDAVRRFNRFYTRQVGALDEHLLESPFSLPEVRVLYEIANADAPRASDIASALLLDEGYLSRILAGLVKQGLVERRRSTRDGRQADLSLTRKGRTAFSALDRAASKEVAAMLERVPPANQAQIVEAMNLIRSALGDSNGEAHLRRPRPGDLGWVVQRHGAIYSDEYGWDIRFEALVADITGKFIRDFDSSCERCWIAERDGMNIGCVFLVRRSKTVAQLRLLLVEPFARGGGLGQRLVGECIEFARSRGYKRMQLWTNDVLISARRIYEAAGFHLIEEERHSSWGKPLTSQTWELKL